MPELKPLPCPNPKCGCLTPRIIEVQRLEIVCPDCLLTLPAPLGYLEWLIDFWNSQPRALTWTTEPPKVAGWYYVRQREDIDKPWSKPRIVKITVLSFERNEYWQWTGPIAPPGEA